jgi:crooked neck
MANMFNMHNNLDEYAKEEDKIGMKIQKPKNNAAASLQITAEQLIKESAAHRIDDVKIPVQGILDKDELNDYKLKKRKEFEDQIKRQKYHIGCWTKYAAWEAHQEEFIRARSVYERALEVDYKNTSLWLKYAEMEMKNKFINHARNVWMRACQLLPRVDQFWYKFAYMEELVGNYIGAREIYKNWMSWEPEDKGWLAFAKFEERMGEINNAREVMYKYIEVHPKLQSYMRVAKFENKHLNRDSCRRIYESALADLGNTALNEDFFIAFIKFEMRNKEFERCRVLFKFGLEKIPKEGSHKLYKFYVKFEKMHGSKEDIEEVIYAKRRIYYEKEIERNPNNYDIWFDYTRLEENNGDLDRTREVYERAITNVPLIMEKKYWRRYIFLWINYAIFEEYTAENIDRASQVYKKALEVVPHKQFTFSKLWILYAHFYLRLKNLDQARLVFGRCIGIAPREKVFKAYIELELQLGNIDRCRTIYEKFIETHPDNASAWIKYAELERSLDEQERCRAIFETAISQPIDMPEQLWKAYINYEIVSENYDKVRSLYERLLEKTKHPKVWLSYSKFEQEIEMMPKARDVLERAYNHFKEKGEKEERLLVLENWIILEEMLNENEMLEKVLAKKPEKVKKLKKDPNSEKTEEYYDYIFPDDAATNKHFKILASALKWHEEQIDS